MTVSSSEVSQAPPNGSALSCEPTAPPWPARSAPKIQCQTLPEVDWTALLSGSCNLLLDGGADKDCTDKAHCADDERAKNGEEVDASLWSEEDASAVEDT